MVHTEMSGDVMEINSYRVYSKASSLQYIQLALIEPGCIVRTWL